MSSVQERLERPVTARCYMGLVVQELEADTERMGLLQGELVGEKVAGETAASVGVGF